MELNYPQEKNELIIEYSEEKQVCQFRVPFTDLLPAVAKDCENLQLLRLLVNILMANPVARRIRGVFRKKEFEGELWLRFAGKFCNSAHARIVPNLITLIFTKEIISAGVTGQEALFTVANYKREAHKRRLGIGLSAFEHFAKDDYVEGYLQFDFADSRKEPVKIPTSRFPASCQNKLSVMLRTAERIMKRADKLLQAEVTEYDALLRDTKSKQIYSDPVVLELMSKETIIKISLISEDEVLGTFTSKATEPDGAADKKGTSRNKPSLLVKRPERKDRFSVHVAGTNFPDAEYLGTLAGDLTFEYEEEDECPVDLDIGPSDLGYTIRLVKNALKTTQFDFDLVIIALGNGLPHKKWGIWSEEVATLVKFLLAAGIPHYFCISAHHSHAAYREFNKRTDLLFLREFTDERHVNGAICSPLCEIPITGSGYIFERKQSDVISAMQQGRHLRKPWLEALAIGCLYHEFGFLNKERQTGVYNAFRQRRLVIGKLGDRGATLSSLKNILSKKEMPEIQDEADIFIIQCLEKYGLYTYLAEASAELPALLERERKIYVPEAYVTPEDDEDDSREEESDMPASSQEDDGMAILNRLRHSGTTSPALQA